MVEYAESYSTKDRYIMENIATYNKKKTIKKLCKILHLVYGITHSNYKTIRDFSIHYIFNSFASNNISEHSFANNTSNNEFGCYGIDHLLSNHKDISCFKMRELIIK